jgi:formylglycine-generating enzyme required for sulfatase activity
VLTVRDDFLGRLAVTVAMRPHLAALSVLAPMTRADLRTAVVGPLGNVGYTLDHEPLAGRIAGDVDGQPASLALLQFACRALWERRDPEARHVRTGDYEALGGAAGALATHAERVLADLSPAQVKQVRTVFLELIGADGTSRPRSRRAFERGDDSDSRDVVELLIARRLLVTSRQPDDGGAQIEIAHETLATAWPRLGRWLDETHEERLLATELEQASDLWARRGCRDEETWTDPALTETLRKVDAWNIELPARSRSFLDAGVARASRRRRVRRWLFSGVVGFLALIATSAVVVAVREVRQRESMALAAADMGKFQLELTAFDWDDRAQQPRPPAQPPTLEWKLRAPSPDALDEPGRIYAEGADIRRGEWHRRGGVQVETVEARSGHVFLEVDRGDCAPSVIAIQRLPGYTERAKPSTIRVNVPTCAATAAGMVEVLAGEFWRSVDGDDGTTSHDELADLATYRIDRTEVTRRAFAMYDAARDLTKDDVASTTVMDRRNDTRADLPIAAISYATARNYCRFMGKQLPTVEQWQKAVRGGIVIAGEPNPDPRRLQVWADSLAEPRVAISRDGADIEVMPVASSPDDRSVYGIVDLAGNLSEWTTTIADKGPFAGLRVAVGSNWSEYMSHRHYRVSWRNTHPDQYIAYSLGARCVEAP